VGRGGQVKEERSEGEGVEGEKEGREGTRRRKGQESECWTLGPLAKFLQAPI